jgi:ATP-dependent protease ClpP protease subunit
MIGHVFIYGGIGSGPGEVSIQNVKSQLDPKADEYVVHIISPGGEVFEGYGIYNILKNSGKKITTNVEGLCASIATLIAFAGDQIIMNRTGEFMIHNPMISDVGGDSEEIRNLANQLDKIKGILIDVSGARAARNGNPISKEKLWALYDNETWLTADEAKQVGFVDEVQDAIKAVAKVNQTNLKKMEEKSVIEKLATKITNLFKMTHIKNQTQDTLEDGRAVVIMDNNGDFNGAQIMLSDGSPLAAGDYELASGYDITVDENSTITAVEQDVPVSDAENKDMDLQKQVDDLKAQLAAALEANKTATAEVASAKAKVTSFQNKLDLVEKDFKALTEATKLTIGDKTPPLLDPKFRNESEERPFDPMAADLGEAYITSRPNSFKRK